MCSAHFASSTRWASRLIAVLTLALPAALSAQPPAPRDVGEVRQIVTFLWQPGRSAEAATIYERSLKPIYTNNAAMRRFRAFSEIESPEPLDLVVVSSYSSMAGMDSANAALRIPNAAGETAFALYGRLGAMTQHHHDQFVEIIPSLSDAAADEAGLTVFEYIRVAPGAQVKFAALVGRAMRPVEKARGLYLWSETGRMLVSDGFDFLRIYGIRSLGDWQRARQLTRTSTVSAELDAIITARKTIILRQDTRLSVR